MAPRKTAEKMDKIVELTLPSRCATTRCHSSGNPRGTVRPHPRRQRQPDESPLRARAADPRSRVQGERVVLVSMLTASISRRDLTADMSGPFASCSDRLRLRPVRIEAVLVATRLANDLDAMAVLCESVDERDR